MSELKPCPFCGSGDEPDELCVQEFDREFPEERYRMYCTLCFAYGPPAGNTEDAILYWNERNDSITALKQEINAVVNALGSETGDYTTSDFETLLEQLKEAIKK